MKAGDVIKKGSVLMTVEGMKMEVSYLGDERTIFSQLSLAIQKAIELRSHLTFTFFLSLSSCSPVTHLPPSFLLPPLAPLPSPLTCPHTQTHILAVKDGQVKTVFYAPKDNVPAFSRVIEFEED